MGGGEEEEGRDGQTHYVVEQFVAEVRPVRFLNSSQETGLENLIRLPRVGTGVILKTQVLDFSSQYGSDSSISYTAHNIVGRSYFNITSSISTIQLFHPALH